MKMSTGKNYLHIYDRNDALGLVKMPGNPVDRLGDKVQHQVQVHFVFLDSVQPKERERDRETDRKRGTQRGRDTVKLFSDRNSRKCPDPI